MTSIDDETAALYRRREDLVLRHVAGENERDLEAIMATFTRARYEIVPTGAVFDGEDAVRGMILQQWKDMPRLRFDAHAVFHGPTGVVVETRTTLPGTSLDMLSMNLFVFEGCGLVNERCYFDQGLMARELGAALR